MDRLQEVKLIRKQLEADVERRNTLYQSKVKIRKALRLITGVTSAGAISTGATAGVSAGSVIGLPVAAPLGVTAVVCSSVCAIASMADIYVSKRLKRHDRLRLVAQHTLSTLGDIIGNFARDGKIDDQEYNFIIDEFDRYKNMVRAVKQGSVVDVKSDIEKAKNDFDERMDRVMKIMETRFQ